MGASGQGSGAECEDEASTGNVGDDGVGGAQESLWRHFPSLCRRVRTRSLAEAAKQMPPMDPQTYEAALKLRGNFDPDEVEERRGKGVRRHCRCKVKYEETSWDVCLREDLAKNKVVWYNHWVHDLWCFSRNSNPIIALFFSHKKHPISWKERYYITLLSFLFVMMISIACVECEDCIACGITSCESNSNCVQTIEAPALDAPQPGALPPIWDNMANMSSASSGPSSSSLPPLPHLSERFEARREKVLKDRRVLPHNYCCSCARSGATWIISNLNIGAGGIVLTGTALYQLIANIIFGQIHFQLAACGCCQQRNNRVRKRWYMAAWFAMGITTPVILVTGPIFLEYAIYNGLILVTLTSFVLGQLKSKSLTSLFQTLVFTFLWFGQRRKKGEGFHVSADEFIQLRERRVREALQLPDCVMDDETGTLDGSPPAAPPPASQPSWPAGPLRPRHKDDNAADKPQASSEDGNAADKAQASSEEPGSAGGDPAADAAADAAGEAQPNEQTDGLEEAQGAPPRRSGYIAPTAWGRLWHTFVASFGA